MSKRKFDELECTSGMQNSSDGSLFSVDDSVSNDSLYNLPKTSKTSKVDDPNRKKIGAEVVDKLLGLSNIFAQVCDTQQKNDKLEIDLGEIKYFTGILKEHQVIGVRWLLNIMKLGINGILADEMGLGKTIQVIALLCHLFEKGVKGPHLITVPHSTLPNWMSEFEKFAPKLPVVYLPGTRSEKIEALEKLNKFYTLGKLKTLPIVITGHKTVPNEPFLLKVNWKFIIVDEAQMIKNHESLLGRCLRSLNCKNKLLLTGTPLQNNIKELWSLLNFIMPKIFSSVDECQSLLLLEDMEHSKMVKDADENNALVEKIQQALEPFMLRRLKENVLKNLPPKKEVNVYCPLTKMQRELYTFTLKEDQRLKNFYKKVKDVNVDAEEEPKSKRRCRLTLSEINMNTKTEMELRSPEEEELARTIEIIKTTKMRSPHKVLHQIVNHPYIIHEPLDTMNEDLINVSGKMLILDKLLFKLKERGHRVLIFSTFRTVIQILEQYAEFRNYEYRTIHGDTSLESRGDYVNNFKSDDNIFLFLMTTRAGGLGINLTPADTVIIFNQDWNPQCDLQAMDRCHRIGQQKPVVVYTFIAKNTIDEKILDFSIKKKRLGNMILTSKEISQKFNMHHFLDFLTKTEAQHEIYTNGLVPSDKEIDEILDRSDMTNHNQM